MDNGMMGARDASRSRRLDFRKNVSSRARQTGYTIWFTGLSASGKTTLASAVRQALLDRGVQRVEFLDGDEMRAVLSGGLGFSPEERTTNMLRIGWVAQLLAKHQIPTLIASIAPYRDARNRVRELVEAVGGHGNFIEVHVDCPLDVCIRRDPKGLYAKALAGKIKNFSGLDDPYETPDNPDIHINTSKVTVTRAVECIITYLATRKLIHMTRPPRHLSRQ